MSTLTTRGCEERLSSALKKASAKRGMSINKLVIETLESTFVGTPGKHRNNDLDGLAGTWTPEESETFD